MRSGGREKHRNGQLRPGGEDGDCSAGVDGGGGLGDGGAGGKGNGDLTEVVSVSALSGSLPTGFTVESGEHGRAVLLAHDEAEDEDAEKKREHPDGADDADGPSG